MEQTTAPDTQIKYMELVTNGINDVLSYTNGLFLVLFIILGWIILSKKDNKKIERTSSEISILSFVGVILGGVFHWLFELYNKMEIFTTLVTYLIVLLIFKFNWDQRLLNIFRKK